MRDLIYMLFLAFESAREAIKDLVEFEPEQAERTIVVLISELEAYCLLLSEFTKHNDFRAKRLQLRWPQYETLVPKIAADTICKSEFARDSYREINESCAGMNMTTDDAIELRRLEYQEWRQAELIQVMVGLSE